MLHHRKLFQSIVLAFVLFFANQARTQITVESNSILPLGMNYNINITDDLNMVDIIQSDLIPSGENAVWNYANLNTVFSRNLRVVEPSVAPFGSQLAGNRVLLMDDGTVNSEYLSATSEAILSTGNINGTGIKAANVPGEVLLEFPATYEQFEQSSFVSEIKFYVGMPLQTSYVVDSVRTTSSTKLMYMIDGWGTLTTPAGTFEVLRQQGYKTTEHVSDFLRADTQEWILSAETSVSAERSYVFWSNTQGYPLLRLRDIGDTGLINDVYWLANPSLSRSDFSSDQVVAYPNPVREKLFLEVGTDNLVRIQLFDVSGRLIFENGQFQSESSIDFSKLGSGTYYLKIEREGKALTREIIKF